MKAKTIFGREPAVLISVIEAALALLSTLVLHWSAEQVGLVMAVVVSAFGLYTAWATTETLLGVAVGLVKAVLALAIGFGFTVSPDVASALISFVVVAAGLFNRTQTSPEVAPGPPAEPPKSWVPVAAAPPPGA